MSATHVVISGTVPEAAAAAAALADANMCSTGEPEPDSGVPCNSWWYSLREAEVRVAIRLVERRMSGGGGKKESVRRSEMEKMYKRHAQEKHATRKLMSKHLTETSKTKFYREICDNNLCKISLIKSANKNLR